MNITLYNDGIGGHHYEVCDFTGSRHIYANQQLSGDFDPNTNRVI
jgi:hypothetical protein